MLTKLIGPKYVGMAKSWAPTLMVWSGAAGVAVIHFTDWRLILDYVPYINGKFVKND